MMLTAMTGHENWKNHACKLHLFVSPTDGRGETHIGNAAKDPTYPEVSTIRNTFEDARPGYRAECGDWTTGFYELPENMILKVFFNRTTGGFTMGPGGSTMANQFIQMREEAALRRLVVQLSSERTARYSAAFIQGKFDLLTFEEATLRGAPVRHQFARFSDPAVLRRAYSVPEIEPETRAKASLTRVRTRVSGGKEVEVVSISRRTRKML